METKTFDAREMACPLPVVNAKKESEEMTNGGTLIILVDNEIAVQNLTKFGNSKGFTVSSEKKTEKDFTVTFQGIGVFAGKGCSGVVAQNDLWELILFGESENEGFHKNLSKLFFTISHGIGGKDGYKTMFLGIRGAGGSGGFSCWC